MARQMYDETLQGRHRYTVAQIAAKFGVTRQPPTAGHLRTPWLALSPECRSPGQRSLPITAGGNRTPPLGGIVRRLVRCCARPCVLRTHRAAPVVPWR